MRQFFRDVVTHVLRRTSGYDERGVNVRLMKKVENYIRMHPEHYDQSRWFYTEKIADKQEQ